MACGDRAGVQSFLEEALRLLKEGESNAEDPLLIYLTAYRLLTALGLPEQAHACLTRGWRLLRRQAARIADPQMRQSFLCSVPVHRQIAVAWETAPDPA